VAVSNSGVAGDYAFIADNAAHDITGTALTISCWYKPNSLDANGRALVAKWDSGNQPGSAYIMYEDNGLIIWAIRGSGGTNTLTSGAFLKVGNWYHLVGVKDGTGSTALRLYADGKLNTVAASTQSIQNSAENFYLYVYQSATVTLNGAMADVALWDASLTDHEILALSRGTRAKHIRPNNLRAYYPLKKAVAPTQPVQDESRFNVSPIAQAGSVFKTVTDPAPLETEPFYNILDYINAPMRAGYVYTEVYNV